MRRSGLILFLALVVYPIIAQEISDSTRLQINDVSAFKMVDTLEYYMEDSVDCVQKVTGGMAGLLLSESTFTNWLGGGKNSVSGIGKLRFFYNRRKGKVYVGNTLNMAIGYVSEGGNLRKTEDRLDYYFKYSRHLKKKMYGSFMLNFKTQFLPGYQYPNDSVVISHFMAPGYLMLKIGLDFLPNRKVKMFFAPLSSKFTFVADENLANIGAFGAVKGTFNELAEIFLTLGKNLRYEFGGFLVLSYKGNLTKIIKLETELDLFSNYGHNPQNIDVDWELEVKVRISKIFSVNFESHLIYDDDIKMEVDEAGNVIRGPAVQFKQLLGLGINITF